MIVFGRKFRNSSTLDDLERAWTDMKEKGLNPDKFTVEIYEKRKAEMIDSCENVDSLTLGDSGNSLNGKRKSNPRQSITEITK